MFPSFPPSLSKINNKYVKLNTLEQMLLAVTLGQTVLSALHKVIGASLGWVPVIAMCGWES